MPRSENQQLRPIYILDHLTKESNEEHPVSTQDIIAMLNRNGIKAERKTIYSDMDKLTTYGFDIIYRKGKPNGWFIASGKFEIPELKLLVDAVQACKFITLQKSKDLISKLSSFVSRHDAGLLNRQVYIADRVKTHNETIYIGIDKIHTAIAEKRQIKFLYCEWNINKELQPKHDGKIYTATPYGLQWDDENYYLIAYDEDAGKIKHFRVDKIQRISVTEEKGSFHPEFEDIDLASYARQNFGMFGAEVKRITLSCSNQMVGVVIDRFGKDVIIIKETNSRFKATVSVAVSPQFFGWLAAFAGEINITGPSNVVDEYKAHIKKITDSLL